MQKINSLLYRFFLPIITGLILAAIVGISSMALEFAGLKVKVNAIQEDLNEVKNNDLPEIKRELQALHVFLIHASERKTVSKTSGVNKILLTNSFNKESKLDQSSKTERCNTLNFLGSSPRLGWSVALADPPFVNFKNRASGHLTAERGIYGR